MRQNAHQRVFALGLAIATAGCGVADGGSLGGAPIAALQSAVTSDGDCTQVVNNPNNNPVLTSPRIVNIYWGAEWATTTTGQKNASSLDDFSSKLIANSFFMNFLWQYGNIRTGSFGGSKVVGTNPPTVAKRLGDANAVTCSRQTSPVLSLIGSLYGAANGNQIEAPTANTLYVVYLPSTVQSQFDMCNNFAGHHFFGTDSQNNAVNYAVIENGTLDTMTSLASHEIVEAVSDPKLSAWQQQNAAGNEIGDICQTNARTRIDGYQIEQYWSNRYCRCVRPEGVAEANGVSQLATDFGRIGVIENGEAYVKQNDLDGGWTWESSNVVQIVLDVSRIGVLKANGDVYVKEGALDAGWVLESSGVSQLAMNDGRIGVVKANGDVYVKEGALDAGWTWESSGVTQLVLAGKRIGVLQSNGRVWVKDGALDAAWVRQAVNAKQIALSYDRIGILLRDGSAWVKAGAISAPGWVQESSGVVKLALDRWRIGIVQAGGAAYVKHGALDALWSRVSDSATSIVLPGNGVGYQWLSYFNNNLDTLPYTSGYTGVVDTGGTAWTTDAF